jgi:hypothetical protein
MALGRPNSFNGQTYSVRLKLKDGEQFLDCAVFDVQKKVGDKKYETVQRVADISGDIVDVKAESKEIDDNTIKSATIEMRDKEERYFVQFSLGSSLGRNLANALLNLTDLNDVRIGLYSKKGDGDKIYPAVALRVGTAKETIKWKYNPMEGEVPAVREFRGKGGKTEKDWSEAEDFFIEKLNEFGAEVRGAAGSESNGSANESHDESSDQGAPAETPEASLPPRPSARNTSKPAPAPVDNLDEDVPF